MPARDESEARTRKLRIDKRLADAGWRVVPFEPGRPMGAWANHAVEEFETASGPADYALVAQGKLLGIVEAKKVSVDARNVISQASRYSKGVSDGPYDFGGFRVPFLYSTNGESIWFRDARDEKNLTREIPAFHTPEALLEMIGRDGDGALRDLAATPNANERLRPYQVDANAAIEAAIRDRRRAMLVAMATGTGKTFMMVNEIYRLMKSGVARRILFLVDRRALAAQAVNAFNSYPADAGQKFTSIYEVFHQKFKREDLDDEGKFDPKLLPVEYLTNPQPKHAFVYVCTIQRMAINLFGRGATFGQGDEAADEDAGEIDIPIHAFDLVVADECHRGYTTAEQTVWRDTLEHFDAVKVGLTATPAAHTKAYFKDVVFRYEYERAVADGYLVDYDPVRIASNVRINGVFLKEGEQIDRVDPKTGARQLELLEDERHYDAADIERRVTAPDSNRKIVEEVEKYADEHKKEFGRFPKTLIFAANDIHHRSHADQLVQICREVFGEGEDFAVKITGDASVDRPLQRIREFRNRPRPMIAVTVDMLSTGVDIPDLEFIVFLRPVKSRILWEQMLGRGTRKGEKFPDKSHFTVFDCFDGTLLAYFRNASAFTVDPPDQPSETIREVIDAVWENRDRDYNVRRLVRRLQRVDKQMSAEAREDFAAFVPEGDVGKFARGLTRSVDEDFAPTLKLLRDKNFQDLLENYRRAASFVVAPGVEDVVSSERLLGKEFKPEDYLKAFEEFVRRNKTQIQALEILLKRPADWSGRALSELRDKLKASPQRFDEKHLQRAFEGHYHKALVDIISMVKLSLKQSEEALTAAERVSRAVERVAARHAFTDEQKKWLERIREHMIVNLAVDPEDFDEVPVLSRHGGWMAADRAFGGALKPLLREFNKEVAA